MKQSLMLVEEQIKSGLFSYNEMVWTVEVMIDAIKRDYAEEGSMVSDFIKALEQACNDWHKSAERMIS